jgi:hypothetical protein
VVQYLAALSEPEVLRLLCAAASSGGGGPRRRPSAAHALPSAPVPHGALRSLSSSTERTPSAHSLRSLSSSPARATAAHALSLASSRSSVYPTTSSLSAAAGSAVGDVPSGSDASGLCCARAGLRAVRWALGESAPDGEAVLSRPWRPRRQTPAHSPAHSPRVARPLWRG